MIRPNCITIAGRKYARNTAALVETLFDSTGTACGTYKASKNGILIADMRGAPVAFIRNGSAPFMVTACVDVPTGRPRYMFGLAEYTRNALGMPEGYAEQSEACRAALDQLTTERNK
jgi:hypothetical protein